MLGIAIALWTSAPLLVSPPPPTSSLLQSLRRAVPAAVPAAPPAPVPPLDAQRYQLSWSVSSPRRARRAGLFGSLNATGLSRLPLLPRDSTPSRQAFDMRSPSIPMIYAHLHVSHRRTFSSAFFRPCGVWSRAPSGLFETRCANFELCCLVLAVVCFAC